jgi:acid phosphatase (class A)
MAAGRGEISRLGDVMSRRSRVWAAISGTLLIAAVAWWWSDHQRNVPRFLTSDPAAFAAQFEAPPAANSAATRRELDELLAMQRTRTPEQVAAARADRKTRIDRFYAALGLDAGHPPRLPKLEKLAQHVEDDVRIQVRGAKDHFRRLRPYEIETRLEPCIDNVRGDLSYPSGHAAYAWSMAYLLEKMVPERRAELESRAAEFARQRMVCGVHFPSDLAAGQRAARLVLDALEREPRFREDLASAKSELRLAMGLTP